MSTGQFGQLILTKDNPSTLEHSARTQCGRRLGSLCATLSVTEAYWARFRAHRDANRRWVPPSRSQRNVSRDSPGVIAGGFAADIFPAMLSYSRGVFCWDFCAGFPCERSANRYAALR